MTAVIAIYTLLLIGFLAAAALVFRHQARFGYLSAHFRIALMAFSASALLVIGFSVYLLIRLSSLNPASQPSPQKSEWEERVDSEDLNF